MYKVPETADYKEQILPEYKNNPLIEALPMIQTMDEFITSVSCYPAFSKSERNLDASLRLHCVYRILDYFQPLSSHIELEQKISRVIRRGYLYRNPLDPQYNSRINQLNRVLRNSDKNKFQEVESVITAPSSASSFTMIGVSGVGKSTGINSVLNLYPQVILHQDYKGNPLNSFQVTWIKIDCPHAGSLKGLCTDFFIEIDKLLGTNYHAKFPSRRLSEDAMLAEVGLIASNHHLGLLVVDELQDLSTAKSGGAEKVLNFFSKLVSTLGLPVIRIGTNKARSILQGDFRHGRRAVGEGSMYWDRMKFETDEEIELWNFFIQGFFKFQWTQKPIPYDDNIGSILYHESQGVVDIAIKLFMIAQWRAIATGIETISAEIIEKVAQDSLHFVRPMLDALKSGEQRLIDKYSDIRFDYEDEIFQTYKEKLEKDIKRKLEGLRNLQTNSNDIPTILNQIIYNLLELGIPPASAKSLAEYVIATRKSEVNISDLTTEAFKMALQGEVPKAAEKNETSVSKTVKQKRKKNYVSGDLRLILDEAKKMRLPAYEMLKQNSIVKSPVIDFYDYQQAC
jgi:hypothetical protein